MKINITPNFTTMVTEHGNIKSYLHKYKILDSPMCPCKNGEQTVDHILFDCKLLEQERDRLVVVIRVMHLGLVDRPFVPQIGIVPSFISRGTPHHSARDTSISEGRKLNIRILPAARNEPQLLGSFTCPKVVTWDRLFDFPSEGRHAGDFYIRKIRRLRPGLNPRTRELGNQRPAPKPLKRQINSCSIVVRKLACE
jgi:hypothetical protein